MCVCVCSAAVHEKSFNPYNLPVIVLPAAVGGGQCGRAFLQVPWLASALGCAGDGDGVDGVGVAVAGAVVSAASTIARSPHKNGTTAFPPLTRKRCREDPLRGCRFVFVLKGELLLTRLNVLK